MEIIDKRKFELYRSFVTDKVRKEYSQKFLYRISSGSTHLISIEQIIDGDLYSSAPREICPSLLRETINEMLKEIKEMKLKLDYEDKMEKRIN